MLSVGGRSTSITSVLGSLRVYYLSLFPMPKLINKRLESLRANFFWGCTDGIKKIPWIAWNSVLASKVKGGLANVHLTEGHDAWHWSLIGSNIFTVRDTQIYIHSISLLDFPIETRWCRFIPRKVNILVWRVLRDRTPTRWNLSRKGIEVPSLLCPLCNISPETSAHLFWSCSMATSIWRLVFKWIDLTFPESNNLNDVFNWLDDTRLN
nr:RNA-directed DNA polymerase, eukaryota [Tanacetum cinerariifolium]